jgi:hypothetical protein
MAPNLGRQLCRVAGELPGEALANELPLAARQIQFSISQPCHARRAIAPTFKSLYPLHYLKNVCGENPASCCRQTAADRKAFSRRNFIWLHWVVSVLRRSVARLSFVQMNCSRSATSGRVPSQWMKEVYVQFHRQIRFRPPPRAEPFYGV